MNLMCAKTIRFIRLAIIIMTGSILFSCASSPSEQSDAINSQLSVQSRSELERHLKEWEEVKPGIKRLIELESDLKFLIAELAKANDLAVDSSSDDDQLQSVADIEFGDEETAEDQTNPFLVTNESEDMEVSSEPNLTSSASPTSAQLQQGSQTTAPTLSDFSAVSVPPPQAAQQTGSQSMVATNRMSEFQPAPTTLDNLGTANNQQQNNAAGGNGSDYPVRSPIFNRSTTDRNTVGGPNKCNLASGKKLEGSIALHLASFERRVNISPGWRRLLAKHNDVLCDRGARSKSTEVNNTIYFSLRVGPYASKGEAIKDCQVLTSRGQYCAISQYEGDAVY